MPPARHTDAAPTYAELAKRYSRHVLRGLMQAYHTTGQTLPAPGMPIQCPDAQGLGLLVGALASLSFVSTRPSVRTLAMNLVAMCPEADGSWLSHWPTSQGGWDQQGWCELRGCLMACVQLLQHVYTDIAQCLRGWREWLMETHLMHTDEADEWLMGYLGQVSRARQHKECQPRQVNQAHPNLEGGSLDTLTVLEVVSLMVLQLRETEFECQSSSLLDEFLGKLEARTAAMENGTHTLTTVDLQLLLHRITYHFALWLPDPLGQAPDFGHRCQDIEPVVMWRLLPKDNGVQTLTVDLHLALARLVRSGQPVTPTQVQRIFCNTHDTAAMARHSQAWCLASTDVVPEAIDSPGRETVAALTESFWTRNH